MIPDLRDKRKKPSYSLQTRVVFLLEKISRTAPWDSPCVTLARPARGSV